MAATIPLRPSGPGSPATDAPASVAGRLVTSGRRRRYADWRMTIDGLQAGIEDFGRAIAYVVGTAVLASMVALRRRDVTS